MSLPVLPDVVEFFFKFTCDFIPTVHSTAVPNYTPPVENIDEDPLDTVWDKLCTSLEVEMYDAQHKDDTDMQQLVKDSNDPSRFRNVLVPKRERHKVLEEAKAARDSAGFLLNGVSEILFSPKELASAKGITKARAGEAALDEGKVDALFEFMKSVCRVNGWPSLDNRNMRRKLTIKICNARRGLKKTPHLETNNEVAGFR
ncbi:hypothetical protein NDU88_002780 [Pleurodeles waltl]|uniref:BEN domain-containing protein n=1 Tax=Pleurodeles waltl TaxID=8319 RepID=A0AAV7NP50_PLEWA|nr:hypothetical protein NDU88_002780 [Pleurodeles waltl]